MEEKKKSERRKEGTLKLNQNIESEVHKENHAYNNCGSYRINYLRISLIIIVVKTSEKNKDM